MPKDNKPRLYLDTLELGAAAGGASVSDFFTPDRDIEVSELLFEAWDANHQNFARENRGSGNTAAGNAIPSLTALEISVTEDGNSVPFQKPFRASLLTSSGLGQRVMPFPFRFYEGVKYKFTVVNKGTPTMTGCQFGFPYLRQQ